MFTTKFGKLVKVEKLNISKKDKAKQHRVGKRYFDMCEKFKLMTIEQLGEIMDEKRSTTDQHAYLNTLREKERELTTTVEVADSVAVEVADSVAVEVD